MVSIVLQKHSNQKKNMVLTQKETWRSMEQNKESHINSHS